MHIFHILKAKQCKFNFRVRLGGVVILLDAGTGYGLHEALQLSTQLTQIKFSTYELPSLFH